MELLAIIGLIFIFWYASKVLTKISKWFFELSNECLDYVTVMKRREIGANMALQQRNKKTAEIIRDIKGDKPNEYSQAYPLYENLSKGKRILLCKKDISQN